VATKRQHALSSTTMTWLVVIVILLVVSTFVGFRASASTRSSGAIGSTKTDVVSSTLLKDMTGIDLKVANTVGVKAPSPVAAPLTISGQSALTSKGRPEILYVGADFCPFCAAERWPLALALGRFGTFTKLSFIKSAPSPEVFPSTPTITFYHSTYVSKYVMFVAVETQTQTHQPLMALTNEEKRIVAKYDVDKYLPANGPGPGGSIPFLDFDNRYFQAGASFSPSLLEGNTQASIARGLTNAASPVTQEIVASANYLTADICSLTNQQPSNVCQSRAVRAAEGKR